MVMPTRRAGHPSEVTSYLDLINWMIRRHVDEASLATLVDTLNVAVPRDDEDELSFFNRLCRLITECGFTYGAGALKGHFVDGVHRAARATVRERNTPGMTMGELARFAQTEGDKHRWLRILQLKDRTKEREALAKEARLRRQLEWPPLPGSPGEHGVARCGTPLSGPLGPWVPQLRAFDTMCPDPRPRAARRPGAATNSATDPGRWISPSDPNPGRESTVAGSVASRLIGPSCAPTWTSAYVTDWPLPVVGHLLIVFGLP